MKLHWTIRNLEWVALPLAIVGATAVMRGGSPGRGPVQPHRAPIQPGRGPVQPQRGSAVTREGPVEVETTGTETTEQPGSYASVFDVPGWNTAPLSVQVALVSTAIGQANLERLLIAAAATAPNVERRTGSLIRISPTKTIRIAAFRTAWTSVLSTIRSQNTSLNAEQFRQAQRRASNTTAYPRFVTSTSSRELVGTTAPSYTAWGKWTTQTSDTEPTLPADTDTSETRSLTTTTIPGTNEPARTVYTWQERSRQQVYGTWSSWTSRSGSTDGRESGSSDVYQTRNYQVTTTPERVIPEEVIPARTEYDYDFRTRTSSFQYTAWADMTLPAGAYDSEGRQLGTGSPRPTSGPTSGGGYREVRNVRRVAGSYDPLDDATHYRWEYQSRTRSQSYGSWSPWTSETGATETPGSNTPTYETRNLVTRSTPRRVIPGRTIPAVTTYSWQERTRSSGYSPWGGWSSQTGSSAPSSSSSTYETRRVESTHHPAEFVPERTVWNWERRSRGYIPGSSEYETVYSITPSSGTYRTGATYARTLEPPPNIVIEGTLGVLAQDEVQQVQDTDSEETERPVPTDPAFDTNGDGPQLTDLEQRRGWALDADGTITFISDELTDRRRTYVHNIARAVREGRLTYDPSTGRIATPRAAFSGIQVASTSESLGRSQLVRDALALIAEQERDPDETGVEGDALTPLEIDAYVDRISQQLPEDEQEAFRERYSARLRDAVDYYGLYRQGIGAASGAEVQAQFDRQFGEGSGRSIQDVPEPFRPYAQITPTGISFNVVEALKATETATETSEAPFTATELQTYLADAGYSDDAYSNAQRFIDTEKQFDDVQERYLDEGAFIANVLEAVSEDRTGTIDDLNLLFPGQGTQILADIEALQPYMEPDGTIDIDGIAAAIRSEGSSGAFATDVEIDSLSNVEGADGAFDRPVTNLEQSYARLFGVEATNELIEGVVDRTQGFRTLIDRFYTSTPDEQQVEITDTTGLSINEEGQVVTESGTEIPGIQGVAAGTRVLGTDALGRDYAFRDPTTGDITIVQGGEQFSFDGFDNPELNERVLRSSTPVDTIDAINDEIEAKNAENARLAGLTSGAFEVIDGEIVHIPSGDLAAGTDDRDLTTEEYTEQFAEILGFTDDRVPMADFPISITPPDRLRLARDKTALIEAVQEQTGYTLESRFPNDPLTAEVRTAIADGTEFPYFYQPAVPGIVGEEQYFFLGTGGLFRLDTAVGKGLDAGQFLGLDPTAYAGTTLVDAPAVDAFGLPPVTLEEYHALEQAGDFQVLSEREIEVSQQWASDFEDYIDNDVLPFDRVPTFIDGTTRFNTQAQGARQAIFKTTQTIADAPDTPTGTLIAGSAGDVQLAAENSLTNERQEASGRIEDYNNRVIIPYNALVDQFGADVMVQAADIIRTGAATPIDLSGPTSLSTAVQRLAELQRVANNIASEQFGHSDRALLLDSAINASALATAPFDARLVLAFLGAGARVGITGARFVGQTAFRGGVAVAKPIIRPIAEAAADAPRFIRTVEDVVETAARANQPPGTRFVTDIRGRRYLTDAEVDTAVTASGEVIPTTDVILRPYQPGYGIQALAGRVLRGIDPEQYAAGRVTLPRRGGITATDTYPREGQLPLPLNFIDDLDINTRRVLQNRADRIAADRAPAGTSLDEQSRLADEILNREVLDEFIELKRRVADDTPGLTDYEYDLLAEDLLASILNRRSSQPRGGFFDETRPTMSSEEAHAELIRRQRADIERERAVLAGIEEESIPLQRELTALRSQGNALQRGTITTTRIQRIERELAAMRSPDSVRRGIAMREAELARLLDEGPQQPQAVPTTDEPIIVDTTGGFDSGPRPQQVEPTIETPPTRRPFAEPEDVLSPEDLQAELIRRQRDEIARTRSTLAGIIADRADLNRELTILRSGVLEETPNTARRIQAIEQELQNIRTADDVRTMLSAQEAELARLTSTRPTTGTVFTTDIPTVETATEPVIAETTVVAPEIVTDIDAVPTTTSQLQFEIETTAIPVIEQGTQFIPDTLTATELAQRPQDAPRDTPETLTRPKVDLGRTTDIAPGATVGILPTVEADIDIRPTPDIDIVPTPDIVVDIETQPTIDIPPRIPPRLIPQEGEPRPRRPRRPPRFPDDETEELEDPRRRRLFPEVLIIPSGDFIHRVHLPTSSVTTISDSTLNGDATQYQFEGETEEQPRATQIDLGGNMAIDISGTGDVRVLRTELPDSINRKYSDPPPQENTRSRKGRQGGSNLPKSARPRIRY